MKIKTSGRVGQDGMPGFVYRPGYEFVSDPSCTEYDWFLVYDELPSVDVGTFRNGHEDLKCPKECTILATSEPISIKRYSSAYTRQFGHLLTNRPPEAEKHPHYHLGRGYYHWFIGRNRHDYDKLVIPPKTRSISVICSSKKMGHTKHAARYGLAEALSRDIPDMDWFGHGIRSFEKKHEVLEPYKYHVTIENHIGARHWTEKLSDAFLAECLPFYAGDPLIGEVFPEKSFIPIPIDDPETSAKIIKSAIANGEYEKRREAVLEAKRLILTKYNFWAQVIALIESEKNQKTTPVDPMRPCRVFERKALRKRNVFAAFEDGFNQLGEYIRRGLGI